MKLLIWIHVMSAIIGIGPTFVFGLFFQAKQSAAELKQSLKLVNKAILFNKIGGPVALLSGIALVMTGNYGTWMQLWLLGAIIIFFLIMAMSVPLGKKLTALQEWLNMQDTELKSLPVDQEKIVAQMNTTINIVHILSILIFTLMILKPVVF